MKRYLSPETAPRDGTIVWGLFQRPGKRNIGMAAAFDVETSSDSDPPPAVAPKWVHDEWEKCRERLRADPVSFFRPLSDGDAAYECVRMIGWRPAAPYRSTS